MKVTQILSACLLGAALMLGGCGGSGNDQSGPLTGVWTGPVSPVTSAAFSGEFRLAWTREDDAVSGGLVWISEGQTYVGRVEAVIEDNEFVGTAEFSGLGDFEVAGNFTTTDIDLTVNDGEILVAEAQLSRQGDNNFAAIAGNYSGTWENFSFDTDGALVVTIMQDGNFAHGTWDAGFGGSGTFESVVIGDQLFANLITTEEGVSIAWNGTVTGNNIAGPFTRRDGEEETNGQFDIDRLLE